MRTLTGIVLGVVIVTAIPARSASVFDVDFEDYSTGAVAGQFNWQGDSSLGQPAAGVFEDAFTQQPDAQGRRHNKVLKVDPSSLSTNDFVGAYLPFGQDLSASGADKIYISFDQFRGTLNQTAFILEAPGARSASSFVGYEYGLDQGLYPTGNVGDFGIPLTAGQWQHVNLTVDFAQQEVSADVEGLFPTDPLDPTMQSQNPQHFDLGALGLKEFRGIGFRVYGTNRGTPNGPNYFDNLIVSNTGVVPEPSSLALLATVIGPLAIWRRRRS